jgi:nucleoside-diphosphate-sugar epimerase
MNKEAKIYVAGHRGMVGSAMMRRLPDTTTCLRAPRRNWTCATKLL